MAPKDELPESSDFLSAPDITPAKTPAQRVRETPNVGTEAANAGSTPHPPASTVAVPQPSMNPPMPGQADTGKGVAVRIDPPQTTERNDLTSVNAPGVIPTERQPQPIHHDVRHGRIPAMDTSASDAAAASMFPQLGDIVRVTVDAVPFMNRRAHHNAIIASGVNGQLGTVIGQEVQGDTLFLRIETATANQLVPADACLIESHSPKPASEMQEPRQSPEKMRKPSNGSYNMT